VYFRPSEAKQLANWITSKFEKTITYTVATSYTFPQTSSSFSQQIANTVVRPTRMWVMPLPTGTLRSSSNTFPSCIGPNILTNFNIQMGGNNLYQQDFKSQYQFYREFKNQLIGAASSTMCGTPISYDDFINGMNPYVFDLSRNPVIKSNNPNNFLINGQVKVGATGADVAAYDLFVIIERLVTCTLKVSGDGITILTKDGAGFGEPVKADP
jgi:hypothetical protein